MLQVTVELAKGPKTTTYSVEKFQPEDAEFTHGVTLFKDDGEDYAVLAGPRRRFCSCMDRQCRIKVKTSCKHIASCEAVGLIPKLTEKKNADHV
jgi:hypothetical protein